MFPGCAPRTAWTSSREQVQGWLRRAPREVRRPWLDVEQLEQTADALEAQQDSEEISAQGLRRENH